MYTRFFLLHITLYHISVIYCISVIYRLSVIYCISVIYYIFIYCISVIFTAYQLFTADQLFTTHQLFTADQFFAADQFFTAAFGFNSNKSWYLLNFVPEFLIDIWYRDCLKNKAKDVASLLLLIPHKRFVANRFWTAGVQLKSNQTLKCYLRMGKNPNSILRGSILINTNVIPIERIQGNPW